MRKTILFRVTLPGLFGLAVSGCLDTATVPEPDPFTGAECARPAEPTDWQVPCGIVVVGNDGEASTVSVLDPADGSLAADGFLTSGSQVPGLSATLSGDVVAAAMPNPDSELVLIDRNTATLTWLNPEDLKVVAQLDVGTAAYGANPQDYVQVGNRAYVARYNPVFGDGGAVIEGDDLLVIDLETRQAAGRIPLGDQAQGPAGVTTPVHPRPTSLRGVGGLVYVMLQNISLDYTTQGPAVLVIVDPESDQVVRKLILGARKNCGGAAYDPTREELTYACGGQFWSGTQQQESALVVMDVSNPANPVEARTIPATTLGGTRTWSYAGLAMVGPGEVLAGVVDPFGTAGSAVLLAVDGRDPVTTVVEHSDQYWNTSLAADPYRNLFYVADGRGESPAVRSYLRTEAGFELQGTVTFMRGLPPKGLAGY